MLLIGFLIFEFVSDFDIRISDFYQGILLILSTIILLRYIRDTTLGDQHFFQLINHKIHFAIIDDQRRRNPDRVAMTCVGNNP